MLSRRLHQLVGLSAVAAAGVAVALAFTAGAARASWDWRDLPSLGYSVNGSSLGNNCHWIEVSGYGHSATLGNDCDPGFQQRLDDFVNATCPCAQQATSTATTTTAATTTTTTQTTTAPAETSPTTTTSTSPPPPPPPLATTTVTTSSPPASPPFADFSAATVNPNVVAFTDASTPGTAAISSHVWQFGDGAADSGPSPSHPFAGPGSYNVTLIVVDANGLTSIAVHQLTIAADHSITLGPRQTQAVKAKPKAKPVAHKKTAKKVVKKKPAKKR